MEVCSLLGKDFCNLECQGKVRKAFAKVKEKQDTCGNYFCSKGFDEYDVYYKYGGLSARLSSLKAPWWMRTQQSC